MLLLYSGSGAGDFSTTGKPMPKPDRDRIISTAIKLIDKRGETLAAKILRDIPFSILDSDNFFGDDFHIAYAVVGLDKYEDIRRLLDNAGDKSSFKIIAETITELGTYIRFVAVDLELEPQKNIDHEGKARGLTRLEIEYLVYKYIGVSGGYLGDFVTYQTHYEFYLELELDINPYEYEGTTRERFIKILSQSQPNVQAKILLGILAKYPVGSSDIRTEDRARKIQAWITRLDGISLVSQPNPSFTSAVVEQALNDAEALIKSQGATSGLDRLHTAFHGFLHAVCKEANLPTKAEASATYLLSLIRGKHPTLSIQGPRGEDITRIIRSVGTIVDAANTLRNRASIAHPNTELLEQPEAMLVINIIRSLLHYLDAKLAGQQE